jgi:hypothetical protein
VPGSHALAAIVRRRRQRKIASCQRGLPPFFAPLESNVTLAPASDQAGAFSFRTLLAGPACERFALQLRRTPTDTQQRDLPKLWRAASLRE